MISYFINTWDQWVLGILCFFILILVITGILSLIAALLPKKHTGVKHRYYYEWLLGAELDNNWQINNEGENNEQKEIKRNN